MTVLTYVCLPVCLIAAAMGRACGKAAPKVLKGGNKGTPIILKESKRAGTNPLQYADGPILDIYRSQQDDDNNRNNGFRGNNGYRGYRSY